MNLSSKFFISNRTSPVIYLVIIVLLCGCSSKTAKPTDSTLKKNAKESCSLIEETWQTYLTKDTNDPNTQDLLKAGWYLINEELKPFAKEDASYANLVDGTQDAFDGNYLSENFKSLIEWCGLTFQIK